MCKIKNIIECEMKNIIEINGIKYEIIYSPVGVDGEISAHIMSVPMVLKKIED